MGVLVLAGAGTAWAARSSDGPTYRTAAVTRGSVAQTVSADSALSVRRTATLAFASGGTVTSVRVAVGSTVHAGEVMATLDPADLDDAVVQAKAALAQAKQQLASDEAAESSTSSDTTSVSSYVALTRVSKSSTAPGKPTTGSSAKPASGGSVSSAQGAVVAAQQALDKAVAAQDHAVKTVEKQCAGTPETSGATATVTPGAQGTVTGSVGAAASSVTLTDGGSAKTQQVDAGDDYTFTGLTAGKTYALKIVRVASIDTAGCTAAVQTVARDQQGVDSATSRLDAALPALTNAIAAQAKSTGSSAAGASTGRSSTGSTGSTGTRSGATASSGTARTGGTSSGSSSASTRTITAEQIAADAKSIDAADATVTLRESQVGDASLTSPISGTVAAVAITSGDSVSAASSSSTITVVGTGALVADLDIPAAQIDSVKVGEKAQITVDGHSTPYPATVSYVGTLDSASSSGSSATYPVTVTLDAAQRALYDGMGATVSIAVGSARDVVTVPLSAIHTIGTRHIVEVTANGKVTAVPVTEGTVGADRVQVTKGLTTGQRVVLADVGAAVPSTTTTTRRAGGSALTGLSGGTARVGGGFGAGVPGAGVPGGR